MREVPGDDWRRLDANRAYTAEFVFSDVELETALPSLVNAIVQNAGQTCSAGSRLLVQKSGYDRIVGAVIDQFSHLRAGTPEMDLDLGPLISARQKKRVEAFCATAKSGHGREKGMAALQDFTTLKTLIVNHD